MTIENQLYAYKEYAEKNDCKIVRDYIDENWKSDTLARPSLDELRQDAKSKARSWEAVLMYDPDRLARKYSFQELVTDELKEAGVEVIFMTVATPKNHEEKIMFGVRGLFAEYERAKITERFRLGKLRKLKQGHVLTTEAPYGYIYIRGDRHSNIHGYYKVNEEEARVVRMIFDWVANKGFTIRDVVRELQRLGIKPRKSKRGVWNTSTLANMFRNRSYIGEAHWGASYAVVPENPIKVTKYKRVRKSSRKMRPEEEWVADKIPVPAIIDPATFWKAREQLKRNAVFSKRNKKNPYLLAQKIWCVCGCTRGGEGPQHGKNLYYRCNNRNYNFPLPRTCFEKGINAKIADALVWDKVTSLMTSPELLQKQLGRWIQTKQSTAKVTVNDVATLEKEIAKLKGQEDRYNKAYGEGALTIEQLKEYNTPIRDRIASAEIQIAECVQADRDIERIPVPTQLEIQTLADEATELLKTLNFELKRAIIMRIIDKITGTPKLLEVYGYLPVTLNHVEYETGHRHRRSSECGQVHAL